MTIDLAAVRQRIDDARRQGYLGGDLAALCDELEAARAAQDFHLSELRERTDAARAALDMVERREKEINLLIAKCDRLTADLALAFAERERLTALLAGNERAYETAAAEYAFATGTIAALRAELAARREAGDRLAETLRNNQRWPDELLGFEQDVIREWLALDAKEWT